MRLHGRDCRCGLSLAQPFPDQGLEIGFGPSAIMGNHFGCGDRAHAQALLDWPARCMTCEEAGRE